MGSSPKAEPWAQAAHGTASSAGEPLPSSSTAHRLFARAVKQRREEVIKHHLPHMGTGLLWAQGPTASRADPQPLYAPRAAALLTSHRTGSSKQSPQTSMRCCNTGKVNAAGRAGPPRHGVMSASLPVPNYNPAENWLCSRAVCTCTPFPWAPTAPITLQEPSAAPLSTARSNPHVPSASSLSPSVALPARHAPCLEGRKNSSFGVWGLWSGAGVWALLIQKAHPWLGLPGLLLAPSTGISMLAALGLRHHTAPNSLAAFGYFFSSFMC